MHDVIVQGVSNQNKVSDVLGIRRNFKLQCVFHGPNGGHRVDGSAHAAEALGKDPTFPGIAPFENGLDTAPHGAASPSLLNSAGLDFNVNAQVAFNS